MVIGPTCGGSAECEPAVTPDGKARLWQPSVCEDESNLCKAAAVLDSAFQELDFDWLVLPMVLLSNSSSKMTSF